MNTVAKGDALEKLIHSYFAREIARGEFGGPRACELFHKKGYFSRDRNTDIIFDVALEIRMQGAEAPTFVSLIECKNYKKPVPVDDAEEFYAKLQQVSASKGILASSSGFQRGTIDYCKSKKIGLLRYFEKSEPQWVLRRQVVGCEMNLLGSPHEAERLLELSDSPVAYSHYVYFSPHGSGTSPIELVWSELRGAVSDAERRLSRPAASALSEVKFMGVDELDQKAKELLDEVDYKEGPVPLDRICANLTNKVGLKLRKLPPTKEEGWKPGMLARLVFDPLEITLFEFPESDPRRELFSLAHELGHYFLDHGRFLSSEYMHERDVDLEPDGTGSDNIRRLEWQANKFASHLLLPNDQVIASTHELAKRFGIRDRGFGLLFSDSQTCNQVSLRSVTSRLRERYRVSTQAIQIRLEELGLLVRP